MYKLLKACMHDSLYKGVKTSVLLYSLMQPLPWIMSTMLHKKSMLMGPMLIMMTPADTGMKLWTTDVLPEQH